MGETHTRVSWILRGVNERGANDASSCLTANSTAVVVYDRSAAGQRGVDSTRP